MHIIQQENLIMKPVIFPQKRVMVAALFLNYFLWLLIKGNEYAQLCSGLTPRLCAQRSLLVLRDYISCLESNQIRVSYAEDKYLILFTISLVP